MASQITGVSIAYSAVCSGAEQGEHQSSTSLAFVRGIHQWPVNILHKSPVTQNVSIWWRHHACDSFSINSTRSWPVVPPVLSVVVEVPAMTRQHDVTYWREVRPERTTLSTWQGIQIWSNSRYCGFFFFTWYMKHFLHFHPEFKNSWLTNTLASHITKTRFFLCLFLVAYFFFNSGWYLLAIYWMKIKEIKAIRMLQLSLKLLLRCTRYVLLYTVECI